MTDREFIFKIIEMIEQYEQMQFALKNLNQYKLEIVRLVVAEGAILVPAGKKIGGPLRRFSAN